MNEIDHFRQAGGDNLLKAWAVAERDKAVKFMIRAVDPVVIHRAQGQIQFLDKMLELMEASRILR